MLSEAERGTFGGGSGSASEDYRDGSSKTIQSIQVVYHAQATMRITSEYNQRQRKNKAQEKHSPKAGFSTLKDWSIYRMSVTNTPPVDHISIFACLQFSRPEIINKMETDLLIRGLEGRLQRKWPIAMAKVFVNNALTVKRPQLIQHQPTAFSPKATRIKTHSWSPGCTGYSTRSSAQHSPSSSVQIIC